MGYISAILVAFFLFYNGIGTTITNPRLVKWARRKNIKIAYSIRRASRKKFSDINETLYRKIQRVTRILFVAGFVLLVLLRGNIISLIILAIALFFALIKIGLTSFNRVKDGVKENMRFLLTLVIGVGVVYLVGDKKVLDELKSAFPFPSQWYLLVLIFAAVNLLAWFVLRCLIKGFTMLSIRFAKLCYTLNSTNPLKPFSLIFQIASVVFSEVLTKVVEHFWHW